MKDSSGQVLALYVVALVALLGLAGLVVDVGHAFFVKRSLQAAADAAATAGASELPDPDAAVSTAHAYSGSPGGANERHNVPGVRTEVSTKCLSIAPCHPVNAIVVEQSKKVNTFFARVLGIDSFDVSARATACSPCGAKPLDVMLVLDRTSSMCHTHGGSFDPGCGDLQNAKDGIRTFLRFMDPELDRIGLAVFPPVWSGGSACERVPREVYDDPSSAYVVAPLAEDYSLGGDLNPSSAIVSTLNCLSFGTRTSYATALEQAQSELDSNGRPGVQDVIVFLSDGGANYGPEFYGDDSPYRLTPCHQALSSAGGAKGRGTAIYTIGYDLGGWGGGTCSASDLSPERPPISPIATLQLMASEPDNFYNQPDPGELNTIYTQIAAELTGTRLVDDSLS